MSMAVGFMEIAAYCKQAIEQKWLGSGYSKYEILYVSIREDDSIKMSQTPHILKKTKQCILIHSWQQLAVTNSYDNYYLQCINQNGEVLLNKLDDDYSVYIYPSTSKCWARISLTRNSSKIYESDIWLNGEKILSQRFSYVWYLYKRSRKECNTLEESKLLGKLAQTEQTVKELESKLVDHSVREQLLMAEVLQYRLLLDEIKRLVDKAGNE